MDLLKERVSSLTMIFWTLLKLIQTLIKRHLNETSNILIQTVMAKSLIKSGKFGIQPCRSCKEYS